MRSKTWIALTLGTVFLVQGCDPDPVMLPDRGVAYFPLSVGKILEYKVDSIIFDDAGSTNKLDTFSAFIRERITDVVADAQGDSVYTLERSHRRTPDESWMVTDIWTTTADFTTATRVEENQRLVKMEFPLYKGRRWDPVRFIDPGIEVPVGTEELEVFAYWDGIALAIDEPGTVGSFQFEALLTCRQADEDTELERRYVLEKYAKGIGLVYRADTILDSRCIRLGDFGPCIGMTWPEKGEKGYIMQLELIAHN